MEDFFKGIVDDKTLRVLKVFLSDPKGSFHINQVASLSGVPVATTFRIMKRLADNGFLTVTLLSKFRIYSLKECSKTRFFRRNL